MVRLTRQITQMLMRTLRVVETSFVFLFLAASSASAVTQLSNLGEPNSFNDGINSSASGAIQFSTGSLAPVWNLDSVTLEFGGLTQLPTGGTLPVLYSAYIYNNSNNAPGSQLAYLGSYNFTNQTASVLQATFNPTTSVSITSNSDYWVIVGANSAGSLEGTGARFNQITGNGWKFGGFGTYFGGSYYLGNPGPYTAFLQIDATAQSVPEPFSCALAGLGIGALALWRRCKSVCFGSGH